MDFKDTNLSASGGLVLSHYRIQIHFYFLISFNSQNRGRNIGFTVPHLTLIFTVILKIYEMFAFF